MEPGDYEALILVRVVLTAQGKYSEALAVFQESMSSHYNAESISMIGCLHALEGRRKEAFEIIEQIRSESKDGINRHAIKLARIHAALGEMETAYRYLEEARDRHEVDLRGMSYDPRWKLISQEPRFQEFVSSLGLPTN